MRNNEPNASHNFDFWFDTSCQRMKMSLDGKWIDISKGNTIYDSHDPHLTEATVKYNAKALPKISLWQRFKTMLKGVKK